MSFFKDLFSQYENADNKDKEAIQLFVGIVALILAVITLIVVFVLLTKYFLWFVGAAFVYGVLSYKGYVPSIKKLFKR